MSRHRPRNPRESVFAAAVPAIYRMEENFMDVTVPVTFNIQDVINWLLPPPIRDKLSAAYLYTEPSEYFIVPDVTVAWKSTRKVDLRISSHDAKIVPPRPEFCSMPADQVITPYLEKLLTVREQFDKVRKVLRWFNEHSATPGLVRHYWPSMGALLPADHVFHEAKGLTFMHIDGMQEIIPLLRETQTIIGSAILLPTRIRETQGTVTIAIGAADEATVQASAYTYRVL